MRPLRTARKNVAPETGRTTAETTADTLMANLTTAASAATISESKVSVPEGQPQLKLESVLAEGQRQLARLQAEFDNYRKRTIHEDGAGRHISRHRAMGWRIFRRSKGTVARKPCGALSKSHAACGEGQQLVKLLGQLRFITRLLRRLPVKGKPLHPPPSSACGPRGPRPAEELPDYSRGGGILFETSPRFQFMN